MNCSQCGRPVPDDAVFCRNCGAPLGQAASSSAPPPTDPGTPPYVYPSASAPQGHPPQGAPPGYPPGYPPGPSGQWGPPPPQRGNRTLVIVLAVTLVILLLVAGTAVALFIPLLRDTTETVDTTVVVESSLPPSTSGTDTSEPVATTATTQPDTSPTGEWAAVDVPQPQGEVYSVAVSDEAVVMDTANGIYAGVMQAGRTDGLVAIPITKGQAGIPTVDGLLTAWWEGDYDETSGTFSSQAIYAMRLPDGEKIEVVGGGRSPAYPILKGGYLTWIEPTPPDGNPDSEIWQEPIYGVPVKPDGSPNGEPDLLTSAPRAYVIGDATWSYSFSGTYLAWEQHQEAEGLAPGVQIMDLESGETRQLTSEGGGRPSVSGTTVVFRSESLQALDLTNDDQRNLDAAGDWPAAAPEFVVYLRTVEGDSTTWDIVARSLTSDFEQVIGKQTTPPWLAAPLAVSSQHIAYVGDDGQVNVFEWRAR